MSIHVHIERLILDGMPIGRHQTGLVRAALEVELTRLLEADGTRASVSPNLSSRADASHAPAATLRLAENASPTAVGAGIARAVHGSLSRPVG